MEQAGPYEYLFQDPKLPDPSDEVLGELESFIISGFDSAVKKRIEKIIDYCVHQLPPYVSSTNFTDQSQINIQLRIVSLLHLIHPTYLNESLSAKIEEAMFQILRSGGPLQTAAFSCLFDHMFSAPHGKPDRLIEFRKWYYSYLQNAIKDVFKCDHKFLMFLLSTYKNNLPTQDQLALYYEIPILLADECLNYKDSQQFFPDIEQICVKSIRACSRFFEGAKEPPKFQRYDLIIKLYDKIPKELKFFHIYQNYLLLCSCICGIQSIQESQIREIVQRELLSNFLSMAYDPLINAKRATIYFTTTFSGPFATEYISVLISYAYQLIRVEPKFASQFLKKCIAQANTENQQEVIDQFMSILELFTDYYNENPIQWGDINFAILNIMQEVMIQFLRNGNDDKEIKFDILIRLTKYISKMLDLYADLYGSTKDAEISKKYEKFPRMTFRKYLDIINERYLAILSNLSAGRCYPFFNRYIHYFVPKSPLYVYNSNFLYKIHKTIKAPAAVILALIEYIGKNPDNIQNLTLTILHRSVSEYIYMDASARTTEEEKNVVITALFRLFCFCIHYQKAQILDGFFIDLLRFFSKEKQPLNSKFAQFYKLLKQNSLNWCLMLTGLQPEVTFSKIAILIFPVLEVTPDDKSVELWFNLFVPALEDPNRQSIYLYAIVQLNLMEYFIKLQRATQFRFFNAVTKYLNNNLPMVAYILNMISDQIIQISQEINLQAAKVKTNSTFVNIDDRSISLEIVFEAMQASENYDIEFLRKCVYIALRDIPYRKSCANEIVDKIINYIKDNDKELLRDLPDTYSGYYYSYMLFEEIKIPDDQTVDFIKQSTFLYGSKEHVHTILKLVNILFEKVDYSTELVNLIIPIIYTSGKLTDFGIEIIKKHIIDKHDQEPSVEEPVINALQKAVRYTQIDFSISFVNKLSYALSNHPLIVRHKKTLTMDVKKIEQLLDMVFPEQQAPQLFSVPFSEFDGFIKIYDLILKSIRDDEAKNKDNTPLFKSSKYQDHIIHLVMQGNFIESEPYVKRDPMLVNFIKMRFLYKLLARIIIAFPKEKQSQNYVIDAFKVFDDYWNRQYLPYFLRQIRKGVKRNLGSYDSWPTNIIDILSIDERQPSTSSLRMMLFFTKTGHFINCSEPVLNLCSLTCDYIQKRHAQNLRRERILADADLIFQIIHAVHDLEEENVKPVPFINKLLELAAALRTSQTNPIILPLEKVVDCYQNDFVTCLAAKFGKDNNYAYFFIMEELFIHPDCRSFAMCCVENLFTRYTEIIEFIKNGKSVPNVAFMIHHFFNCVAEVARNPNTPPDDLFALIKIIQKVFDFGQIDVSKFKPTIFSSMLDAMIPPNIENYVDNANLVNIILTQSIPYILKKPAVFFHPIMINRIAKFFSLVPGMHQKSLELLSSLPEGSLSIAFLKQVLYKFYELSPPTEKIILPVGKLSEGNLFEQFIFDYSGAQLAMYENVEIEDIMEVPSRYLSAHIGDIFIKRGYMDKMCLQSMSRISKSMFRPTIDVSREFNDFIDVYPYWCSLSFHILRDVSGQTINISSEEYSRYWMGFGLNYLFKSKQTIQQMQPYAKYIATIAPQLHRRYHAPFLNMIIGLILYYLEKFSPKEYVNIIISLVPVFEVVAKDIDIKEIFIANLDKFRNYLREKIEGQDRNVVLSQIRFVYSTVQYLARFLWLDETFFPQPLSIVPFLESQYPPELLRYYKEALKAAVLHSKNVIDIILNEIMTFFKSGQKKIFLSPILPTPFATVINWYSEVTSLDPPHGPLIEHIVESLKPQTVAMLLQEIKYIVLPIPAKFTKILLEVIASFPSFNDRIAKRPSMTIYKKLFQAEDLQKTIWEIDWPSMPPSTHLYTFASLLFPSTLASLMLYISEENVCSMLCESLLSLPFNIKRFVMYYTSICPDTSLSNFFRTTGSFHDSIPLPHKPIIHNVQYLTDIAMFDDALALAELKNPVFSKAVKFNQLFNYEAAAQAYLDIMAKEDENFSLAMSLFSPVRSNLKYPIDPAKFSGPTAYYNLPFVRMFSQTSDKDQIANQIKFPVTKFLHPLIVSIERRMAMFEYDRQINMILKPPPDARALRKLRTLPFNSLDLTNCVSSILGMRTFLLSARYEKQPNQQSVPYQAFIAFNYSRMSVLMSKSGSIRRALKALLNSIKFAELHLQSAQIQQFLQQTTPQIQSIAPLFKQAIDTCAGMNVSTMNVGRVYRFLSQPFNVQVRPLDATRQNYFIAMRDLGGFIKSTPQTQQSISLYNEIFTFLYAYDFKQIKPDQAYEILLGNTQQATTEQGYYATTLAFAILKKFPESTNDFIKSMELHYRERTSLWLRWLPHFFTAFKDPPRGIISMLIKYQPQYTRAMLRNVSYMKTAINQRFISEEINKMIMENPSTLYQISDCDSIFKWTQYCEADITEFKKAMHVALRTVEELALSAPPHEELVKITGPDISQYLLDHPPYFKTNLRSIDMGTPRGFKIPLRAMFYHAEIDAPGDREATLTFVSNKGGQTIYTISSALLYPPNYSEEIILYCIQKIFETHPSSAMRTSFVYINQLFYLHNDIVLLQGEFQSLQTIANKNIAYELLKKNPERVSGKSPAEILERRDIDVKSDCLFEWISKGANGNVVDFLQMKQCLAAFIASYSALKFLFMSEFKYNMNIVFGITRQTCFIPNTTKTGSRVIHLPLTPTIRGAFPMFTLKGIFSATWQTVMETMSTKRDKIRVILGGLVNTEPDRVTKTVLRRAEICSTMVGEDTDKEELPFPFALINHLIDNSGNAFMAQELTFGWI